MGATLVRTAMTRTELGGSGIYLTSHTGFVFFNTVLAVSQFMAPPVREPHVSPPSSSFALTHDAWITLLDQ